ncbi:stage II sporulation protein P [Natranaerobius thermophilus]|uniref:stage II sporulation protein P n=1 Tax=Natranaerobius thermophilus TaxID=375929 RepID=UPI002F4197EF
MIIQLLLSILGSIFIEKPYVWFLEQELPGFYVMEIQDPPITSLTDALDKLLLHPLAVDSNSPETILGTQFSPVRDYSKEIQAMAEEQKPDQKSSKEVVWQEETGLDLSELPEEPIEDSPQIVAEGENLDGKVGIYHSHTTESFVPDSGEPFTENLDKTVVELGRKLTEELADYNIETVHTEEVHDLPTRRDSYSRSLPTIENMMEENPEIDVLLDIHRDGVPRNMTTTEIEGEQVGKILILVGSEGNPDWRENYRFALQLQKQLEKIHPDLSRGIRTRNFSYNQEVHSRSLLIEIGGHENSLEEAKNTIPYLAEALKKAAFAGD